LLFEATSCKNKRTTQPSNSLGRSNPTPAPVTRKFDNQLFIVRGALRGATDHPPKRIIGFGHVHWLWSCSPLNNQSECFEIFRDIRRLNLQLLKIMLQKRLTSKMAKAASPKEAGLSLHILQE
jgi:hypothetical protein